MNKAKSKIKGLSGLANLGNTCYLNSCLQILCHSKEINDLLFLKKNKNALKNTSSGTLVKEWLSLVELMWKENVTVSPNRFLRAIQLIAKEKGYDDFTDYEQNDMGEFLMFIMDIFHESISRPVNIEIRGSVNNGKDKFAVVCYKKMKDLYKENYSELISKTFGIQGTEIREIETNKIEIISEPFSIMLLPIPSKKDVTLYDCIEEYLKEELLDGENGRLDEKTKKHLDIKKRIILWSLPEILMICLNRFDIYGNKNKQYIDFPLIDLDMNKYVKGYKGNYTYDLYAVSNHSGVSEGGHYTSCIKVENRWFNFNDTSISELTKARVVTAKAYCLFFKKRDLSENLS